MDVPLIVAGSLALFGAGLHRAGGELLVVRKLSQETLPASRFGGPRMTKAMIHTAWHLTTVAFLTVGVALILAGTALDGDAAVAVGVVCAAACTAFALVVLGLGGAYMRSPGSLFRHPAPTVLGLAAALAWWGAL